MEKTFAQISELFDQFSKDASLQVEKGNKAAGTRARKASLELEKLLKRFRKESLEASKLFLLWSRRYGNGGIACTISKKNFSFHSGEALLVVIKLNINYVKFLFRF